MYFGEALVLILLFSSSITELQPGAIVLWSFIFIINHLRSGLSTNGLVIVAASYAIINFTFGYLFLRVDNQQWMYLISIIPAILMPLGELKFEYYITNKVYLLLLFLTIFGLIFPSLIRYDSQVIFLTTAIAYVFGKKNRKTLFLLVTLYNVLFFSNGRALILFNLLLFSTFFNKRIIQISLFSLGILGMIFIGNTLSLMTAQTASRSFLYREIFNHLGITHLLFGTTPFIGYSSVVSEIWVYKGEIQSIKDPVIQKYGRMISEALVMCYFHWFGLIGVSSLFIILRKYVSRISENRPTYLIIGLVVLTFVEFPPNKPISFLGLLLVLSEGSINE